MYQESWRSYNSLHHSYALHSRLMTVPLLPFPLCHTNPPFSHHRNVAVSDRMAVALAAILQYQFCARCSHHNGKRISIWKTCTRLVTTLALTLAAQYVRFWKRFPCLILKNSFKQMIMCRRFKTQCQIWNWLSNLRTVTLNVIDPIPDRDHPGPSQLYSLFERIPTQYFKRHITLRYHSSVMGTGGNCKPPVTPL